MVHSDKTSIDLLINKLRDPDPWEAWNELRQMLETEPEIIVPYLCKTLDEFIEDEFNEPIKVSIIISMYHYTSKQPDLLTVPFLQRILANDKRPYYFCHIVLSWYDCST